MNQDKIMELIRKYYDNIDIVRHTPKAKKAYTIIRASRSILRRNIGFRPYRIVLCPERKIIVSQGFFEYEPQTNKYHYQDINHLESLIQEIHKQACLNAKKYRSKNKWKIK